VPDPYIYCHFAHLNPIHQANAHGEGVKLLVVSKQQMMQKRELFGRTEYFKRREKREATNNAKMKKVFQARIKGKEDAKLKVEARAERSAMAERFHAENKALLDTKTLDGPIESELLKGGQTLAMPIPKTMVSEKQQIDYFNQAEAGASHVND
jgi:hypothetical protein